jgi:septum site-determining protein MinD
MLSVNDVLDILSIPLLSVIPESPAVLRASNFGVPVTLNGDSDAHQAYVDAVSRLLGEEVPFKFVKQGKRGLLRRLFGREELAT